MLSDYFFFTEEEFKNAKSRQLLPCKCQTCQKVFYRAKNKILTDIKNIFNYSFCSRECSQNRNIIKKIKTTCEYCGKEFERQRHHMKKNKFQFCSKSCSAKYYNAHKTTGYRRSKLEIYLETKLTEIFPDIEILYNDRNTLPSGLELDIYVPALKLAFELNGPFHYIPAFGQEKLNRIQNNDYIKMKECQDLGINICVIDTSKQKNFTQKSCEEFLEIIKSFIR